MGSWFWSVDVVRAISVETAIDHNAHLGDVWRDATSVADVPVASVVLVFAVALDSKRS